MRFLTGLSTTVSLPEPVDVVVTETIGNFGLEEGILGWLIDARRRFLKPGGALIPRSLKLFAAPVELGDEDRPTGSWPQALCGVDFSAAQVLEANNLHWLELRPDDLLSAPASLGSIDLCQVTDDTFSADVAVSITRDGTCHGIGGWFSAQLTSTVTLSNAPPLRTPSWRHAFLPLSAPLSVAAGDAVAISVACYRNGAFWAWRLAPGEPGGGDDDERRRPAPRQTTLAGQLLSAAELRLRRPSCVPVLSRQGRVDRFILGQFDGVASVAEIARRAMREFSECFRSEDDALERVRRLAVRYGGDA